MKNFLLSISTILVLGCATNNLYAYRNFFINVHNDTNEFHAQTLAINPIHDSIAGNFIIVNGNTLPRGQYATIIDKSNNNWATGKFLVCDLSTACKDYCKFSFNINSYKGYTFKRIGKAHNLYCPQAQISTHGKDNVFVNLSIGGCGLQHQC